MDDSRYPVPSARPRVPLQIMDLQIVWYTFLMSLWTVSDTVSAHEQCMFTYLFSYVRLRVRVTQPSGQIYIYTYICVYGMYTYIHICIWQSDFLGLRGEGRRHGSKEEFVHRELFLVAESPKGWSSPLWRWSCCDTFRENRKLRRHGAMWRKQHKIMCKFA